MKHIFLPSILFKSHLIRYSGTGRAFKDTLRALEHLRHSESTGALGHSESTRRALGHLMHMGTRTIMAHGHLEGTRALGGHLRHLGTRGTLFSTLKITIPAFWKGNLSSACKKELLVAASYRKHLRRCHFLILSIAKFLRARILKNNYERLLLKMGTWALEAIYLADSNFPQFYEHIFRSSRCRRSSKYVLLKISQYAELKSDSNTGVFL